MFSGVNAIIALVFIQILFSCPDWFQWLEDWELTENAKLTKDISQMFLASFTFSYHYWLNNNLFTESKKKLNEAISNYDKQNIALQEIDHFSFCILLGIIITFFSFLLIAWIAYLIKTFNVSSQRSKYVFIRPRKDTINAQNVNSKIAMQNVKINNLTRTITRQGKELARLKRNPEKKAHIKDSKTKHVSPATLLKLLLHW